MKKRVVWFLGLTMLVSLFGCASPAVKESDKTKDVVQESEAEKEESAEAEKEERVAELVEGVTTVEDEQSPTGYKTTFVYKDSEA